MAVAVMGRRRAFRPRQLDLAGVCASYVHDLNPHAFSAGIATFVWYAIGLVPIQIAVTSHFALASDQLSSWLCIIWLSGSVFSIALSLRYRLPIPITSSIPCLLLLGAVADRFSFAELAGANIMAGIFITVLGLVGVGGRVLAFLPMPIAMGMLAGSVIGDVTNMVQVVATDGLVPCATVLGYLIGRLLNRPHVPPIAVALAVGSLMIVMTNPAAPVGVQWHLPSLVVPQVAFTPSAFVSVSIPLMVLSLGLGHVQGLGFLVAQGYKVPVNRTTVFLGITSIVNAMFGGHTAIVSRNGMPILAGPEAGPINARYWANLTAALLCLTLAFGAGAVASLVNTVPKSFVVVLAGLAILPSLQNAFQHAFGGRLRFGATVALVVAATGFTGFGLTSALWALVAALVASWVAERDELMSLWRSHAQVGEIVRECSAAQTAT